jgi:twitching motility protein PilI
VLGLRNPEEMELQANSPSVVVPWAARRYLDSESNIWTELNLALIAQDPQFLHVGL